MLNLAVEQIIQASKTHLFTYLNFYHLLIAYNIHFKSINGKVGIQHILIKDSLNADFLDGKARAYET